MSELKPCPFCGGDNLAQGETKVFGMSARSFIKCLNCSAEMTRSTKRKAEQAWNRRADNDR